MREHIRKAPANKSHGYLPGITNKTHRQVAIIEGFNHSSAGQRVTGGCYEVARDYKEITLFRQ